MTTTLLYTISMLQALMKHPGLALLDFYNLQSI